MCNYLCSKSFIYLYISVQLFVLLKTLLHQLLNKDYA